MDESARYFKAIAATDSNLLWLFQSCFVKQIEVLAVNDAVKNKVRCEPEMKTGTA